MSNPSKIKTAIVILNWNGKHFLEQFLPSVVKFSQGIENEIIVADNGSSDDSIIFLKTKFPEVKILAFEKNYGFTGGYNKALFQIDADYFVLLNSDIEVTENWLKRPTELLDSDPNIAAVAPKIKAFHNKTMFEYAGAAGGFIDKYGYPFCRGRILGEIEADTGQYDDECDIAWASGACMFVRASLYKSEGGLDDDFFAHMEEIDLCTRLKNRGFNLKYTSQSVVYHVGGGTLPNNNPRKLFLNYRNNLLFLYKNLPKKHLLVKIFSRMVLDGLSAIVYLLKFQFAYFAAVWKAHISFYKMLPNFKQKRRTAKSENKPIGIDFNRSIVWNYYVKKNKKFSDFI